MPTPFIMPKFDMDQETSRIINWVKKEGDPVSLDEVVLEVETDKVSIEVPAPASGILAGIQYSDGDEVPVTTVIAYILKDGETLADIQPETPTDTKTADTVEYQQKQVTIPEQKITPVAQRMAVAHQIDVGELVVAGKKITKADVEGFIAENQGNNGVLRLSATPAARRLGREKGIELAEIVGTGPGGRIQLADVLEYQKADASVTHKTAVVHNEHQPELISLEGMRLKIANRMQASFQEAPHISLSMEIDVSKLETLRHRLNRIATKEDQNKISMTALIVKVVAWALAKNRYLNSSLQGDVIKIWPDVNVGVAVALEEGLIVPVVRNADKKTVSVINSDIRNLVEKARQGNLELDDIRGGTFTISNLGMFGIHQFRAIINPPESAILAVGAVIRKPVVISDQDDIEVRPIMEITLSADHRVIDGAVAAYFLQDLANGLESPEILMY
ncbi:MAG: 2-oxo acid dehydrogenase subunit E2 [Chloroflexi bacterium]|nr:2-oxo acid dehydrogenase subunit E2 [Chloroflexota bacterium]